MKLKYKIPFSRAVFYRRRTILIVLLVGLIARAAYAYISDGDPLEVRVLRNVTIALTPDRSQLPTYEIFANQRDTNKLIAPGAASDSFADVDIRYTNPRLRVDSTIQAKMRRRGNNRGIGLKHRWKVVFEGDNALGSPELHLLSDEIKSSHWYPWHMWLGRELGLKTPRTRFVRVKLNGADLGLFVEMEHWGKTMLERYGLSKASLFGENDRDLPYVNRYLYDNTAKWKNYNPPEGDERNFTPLDHFLTFLSHSDDAMFRKHLFSFVDKDNLIAWHVHMVLMDSYHQCNAYNARIIYNNVTGLLEFLPWDALPEFYNSIHMNDYEIYVTHRLLLRLRNFPEYLEAYSRRLYGFLVEYLPKIDPIYMDMYSNADVAFAVYKDEFRLDSPLFQQLRAPSSTRSLRRNLGTTADDLFGWQLKCKERIRRIRRTWKILKRTTENAALFVTVDRDAHKSTQHEQKWAVRLGYDAQVPARIDGLRMRMSDWRKLDGQSFPITMQLEPRTHTALSHRPLFPSERLPEAQRQTCTATVSNGYLLVADVVLLLMPGFPKLEPPWKEEFTGNGEIRNPLHIASVETQEYELTIELTDGLSIDINTLDLQVRNLATFAEASVEYKYVDGADYQDRLLRSADPRSVANKYDWLSFDEGENRLIVTKRKIRLQKTLIVPKGTLLVVGAGTRFTLGEQVSVISFSPIHLEGTRDEPISFEPAANDSNWGVLAVVDCQEESVLRNVQLRGGSRDLLLGIDFEAALCFHRAKHVRDNCAVTDSLWRAVSVIRQEGRRLIHE